VVATRKHLIQLIEKEHIPQSKIIRALKVSQVQPDTTSWLHFIDRLLLWLGGLSLSFAALFFIAFNWDEIGRFAKFGMVELLIIFAIISYTKLGTNTTIGKVSLMAATIFLGVLLALYGQTYQTGADPWQLFFNWALLALPWTLLSRNPSQWVLWILLINTSIVLYLIQSGLSLFGLFFEDETSLLWLLFSLNATALVIWEAVSNKCPWLVTSWAARVLALAHGIPITLLVLSSIFESSTSSLLPVLMWMIWLSALYTFYRKQRPDLFMLAGGCLSFSVITVSFISKHILKNTDAGAFLLIGFIIIGLGAVSAVWLKNLHREFNHE